MRTNTCKRTWYTRREVKRKGHKKVDEHEDTGDEISGERLIESTHVSWAKCKRVLYCQPTSITTYRPLFCSLPVSVSFLSIPFQSFLFPPIHLHTAHSCPLGIIRLSVAIRDSLSSMNAAARSQRASSAPRLKIFCVYICRSCRISQLLFYDTDLKVFDTDTTVSTSCPEYHQNFKVPVSVSWVLNTLSLVLWNWHIWIGKDK